MESNPFWPSQDGAFCLGIRTGFRYESWFELLKLLGDVSGEKSN